MESLTALFRTVSIEEQTDLTTLFLQCVNEDKPLHIRNPNAVLKVLFEIRKVQEDIQTLFERAAATSEADRSAWIDTHISLDRKRFTLENELNELL